MSKKSSGPGVSEYATEKLGQISRSIEKVALVKAVFTLGELRLLRYPGEPRLPRYEQNRQEVVIADWALPSIGCSFFSTYNYFFAPGDLIVKEDQLYQVEEVESRKDYDCWEVYVIPLQDDDPRNALLQE